MEWFKHKTDGQYDIKLKSIVDKYGYAGLGWYWTILEFYAGRVTKDLARSGAECWVDVHLQSMRLLLRITTQRLIDFLQFCAAMDLWTLSVGSATAKLSHGNLLKSFRTGSLELELDLDLERLEREIEADTNFEFFKNQYLKKTGNIKQAYAVYLKTVTCEAEAAALEAAIANYNKYIAANAVEERYIKNFSTFLAEWSQWVNYKPKPTGPSPIVKS